MKNDFLCKARQTRGWTQLQEASKLGVAVRTVRSWERGDRTPSLQQCLRLCDHFDMTATPLGLEQNGTEQLIGRFQ